MKYKTTRQKRVDRIQTNQPQVSLVVVVYYRKETFAPDGYQKDPRGYYLRVGSEWAMPNGVIRRHMRKPILIKIVKEFNTKEFRNTIPEPATIKEEITQELARRRAKVPMEIV